MASYAGVTPYFSKLTSSSSSKRTGGNLVSYLFYQAFTVGQMRRGWCCATTICRRRCSPTQEAGIHSRCTALADRIDVLLLEASANCCLHGAPDRRLRPASSKRGRAVLQGQASPEVLDVAAASIATGCVAADAAEPMRLPPFLGAARSVRVIDFRSRHTVET